MSDAAEIAIVNEPPISNPIPKGSIRKQIKELWHLVAPYWRCEEKVFAWTLLSLVLSLKMLLIYLYVRMNSWQAAFYDALQALDKKHFSSLLLQFLGLVMILVVVHVSAKFIESYLAFRWRLWLTKGVMHNWLSNNIFCRLFITKTKTENPDQRISQDIALFTASSLTLSLSCVYELVKSVVFAIILWKLSSNILLPLPGGGSIDIPGYMLWVTIIYVSFSTFIIYKAGKPLVALDYAQEKVEADFRFNLMRIRERRDEVSILNGAQAEAKYLLHNLSEIIKNYKHIIYRNIYVNSFQNVFLNLTTILPILAAAPMFFSGIITLGVLMQIGFTFNKVEESLLMIAANFQAFASWKATFNRIVDFRAEMQNLQHDLEHKAANPDLHVQYDPNELRVSNLTLKLPNQQDLATFNFNVLAQEKVLLMGRSGLGKSTLIKCIAGQWPFAAGSVQRPQNISIIPQKPYFPIGKLRDSLLYPTLSNTIADAEMQRVLQICGLEHLCDKLDIERDWLSILSLGEQQRLNFARVILSKPQWLILDEPTASMDKELETRLFKVLFAELPDLSLVTIGHALSLKDLHTRYIEL